MQKCLIIVCKWKALRTGQGFHGSCQAWRTVTQNFPFIYGQNAQDCFSSKSSVLMTSHITHASGAVPLGRKEEEFELLLLFGNSELLTTN